LGQAVMFRLQPGIGHSKRLSRMSFVALTAEGVEMPSFCLMPKASNSGLHVLYIERSLSKVQFANDEYFSGKCVVYSSHKSALKTLLSSALRQQLADDNTLAACLGGSRTIVIGVNTDHASIQQRYDQCHEVMRRLTPILATAVADFRNRQLDIYARDLTPQIPRSRHDQQAHL